MPNHHLLDVAPGSDHSPVGGSVMPRILRCPGSVLASHGIPNKDSAYANEGSFAHAYAEACLTAGEMLPKGWQHPDFPNYAVDPEMFEAIGRYVRYIREIHAELDDAVLHVEQKVKYEHLIRNGFGTADCIIACDEVLHVIDLKYGQGVIVTAEENEQLLTYGAATHYRYSMLYDYEKVVLHICQPRREHFDKWETTVERIREFEAQVRGVAELIVSDDPPFVPGEKQCQFCPASPCKAQMDAFNRQVGEEFDLVDDESIEKIVTEIPITDALKIIENIPLYRKFLDALERKQLALMLSGVKLPNWKLVQGRKGNRAWAKPEEEIVKILTAGVKDLKPEDLYEKPKLVSPSKAETYLKQLKPKTVELLVVQPEGKLMAAPASDKRAAVEPSNVADEFETVDDRLED